MICKFITKDDGTPALKSGSSMATIFKQDKRWMIITTNPNEATNLAVYLDKNTSGDVPLAIKIIISNPHTSWVPSYTLIIQFAA